MFKILAVILVVCIVVSVLRSSKGPGQRNRK